MITIIIDEKTCCGSGECVKICPEKAISLVDGIAVLDESRCDFDGICIPACPSGAIRYEETEPGGCGF
ncbi:MAG: 4Fe-4S binding protein [Desulfuromonadales bacterium]|nr:4Fe-4S binding protein [Desulfuromonadales bacterium]